MKIKTILIGVAIMLIAFSSNVKGQSLKDYFLPESPYTKAFFYWPTKNGKASNHTKVITYMENGDNYDVIDTVYDNKKSESVTVKTVQVTDSAVKIIQTVSTVHKVIGKEKDYDPPITIMRIPVEGQTVDWTSTDLEGAPMKCTAVWTTVMINNENRQAIKVESKYTDLRGKNIDYYVKGIGLWKLEVENSSKAIIMFYKFDRLNYSGGSGR